MFLQGGSALWFCPLIANAVAKLELESNLIRRANEDNRWRCQNCRKI